MHCMQPVTGIHWLYSAKLLSLSCHYVTTAWRCVPHSPLRPTALDACCLLEIQQLTSHSPCPRDIPHFEEAFFVHLSKYVTQSELQNALSHTKLNLQFIHTRKHIQSLIEVSRLTTYTTIPKKVESKVYAAMLLRIESFGMWHIPTDIQERGRGGVEGYHRLKQTIHFAYIFPTVINVSPDGVSGIFQWHNPSGCTMALGSNQPLTEMSTRCISWG